MLRLRDWDDIPGDLISVELVKGFNDDCIHLADARLDAPHKNKNLGLLCVHRLTLCANFCSQKAPVSLINQSIMVDHAEAKYSIDSWKTPFGLFLHHAQIDYLLYGYELVSNQI